MKTRLLATVLCALPLTLGACVATEDGGVIVDDATLTVSNQSDFVIDELYLAADYQAGWGGNYLGGNGLFPSEEVTLGADCGTYDIRVVAEDGLACEQYGVDLCLNDATFIIRNNTCPVFERAAAAKKALQKTDANTSL